MDMRRELMADVCWAFVGSTFTDRIKFESELKQYQAEITGNVNWDPSAIVADLPAMRVQYVYWEDFEEIEQIVMLVAENGSTFSAGEAMFALHNAVVCKLAEIDHHFFEGLILCEEQERDKPPLYELQQGS